MFLPGKKLVPLLTPTANNHTEFQSSLYENKLMIFYTEYKYFPQNYQANKKEYNLIFYQTRQHYELTGQVILAVKQCQGPHSG